MGQSVLRLGSIHPEVKELHRLLNAKLFPHPNLDETSDLFDIDTEDAVILYQGQHNLEPDGIVGRNTWKSLGEPLPIPREKGATPAIKYARADMVKLSANGERVLQEILDAAGVKSCLITSTLRTAAEQARIMYDNIKQHGKASQYKLYGTGGDRIVKVYDDNEDKSRDVVIGLMRDKIEETKWGANAGHRTHGRGQDTFDVAPSSIEAAYHRKFHDAIRAHPEVFKYHEAKVVGGSDPAFHIEVKHDSLVRKQKGAAKAKAKANAKAKAKAAAQKKK